MPKSIQFLSLILGVFVMSFLVGYLAFAWTEPASAPPSDNMPIPLNVSDVEQSKEGKLWVGYLNPQYTIPPGAIAANSFYDAFSVGTDQYYLDPSSDLISAALRGKVGIGIAVPTHTLHAYSKQLSIPQYYFDTDRLTRVGINSPTTPNPNTGIGFYIGDALKWSNAVYQAVGTGTNYDYTLWNDQASTTGLFIDGDTNNVGIGTMMPSHKLDVNGALRLQPSAVPAGANGTVYYDSSTNTFRCFQNGAWADCIGTGGGGGGGGDPSFPDGIGPGQIINITAGSSYTQPAGKTLYITTAYCDSGVSTLLKINGKNVYYLNCGTGSTANNNFLSPLTIGPGQTITFSNAASNVHVAGFEVPTGVTPVFLSLTGNASYTQPAGKTLYITTAYCDSGVSTLLKINGKNVYYLNCGTGSTANNNFLSPLTIGPGHTVTFSQLASNTNLIGYEK
jgi:hypothetical protein